MTPIEFFEEQLKSWPAARANFHALNQCRVKRFDVDGMTFGIQFNPARAISSSAKVDNASIKARPCFLCRDNRPAEQIEMHWNGYTILVNPFPIFNPHFTIAADHTPQRIDGRMADMIALSRLMPGFTIFYNGPGCGASAPDHMHFQAGPNEAFSLFEAATPESLRQIAQAGSSTLSASEGLPVPCFVIDAANPREGEDLFRSLYKALPVSREHCEPMINILARHRHDGHTTIIIIPRKAHRPDFYGNADDGLSMLISPASVDLGGFFILPRQADFARIDPQTIRNVLQQVCVDDEQLNIIAENVR